MTKRDLVLRLLDHEALQSTIPAAFFLHFDADHRTGVAAVEKHKEFFHSTGMDFVKVQLELPWPNRPVESAEGWANLPRLGLDFFAPQLEVVRALVEDLGSEALVVVTLYSPFMVANDIGGAERLRKDVQEAPEAAMNGIDIAAESLLTFVGECINLGVDGFYQSTQGGEAHRFADPSIFLSCVKPFDLKVMNEIDRTCPFSILHICDYHRDQYGGYSDLSPFADYPGQVVNCNLDGREPQEISDLFKRPFMGGMDRKGKLATGTEAEARAAARAALSVRSSKFILGADCTVAGDTPWGNLRAAIEEAHG